MYNCLHVGKRSSRDELMKSRAMSSEPTAGAQSERRHAAAARRGVSMVESPTRGKPAAAAAKAEPLLA